MIKKIIILIAIILLVSCEDSVNTNAEFRERFVLTSIINCESDNQIAYITKTYDNAVMEINPDNESIFVHGADVKIWYDYEVYSLADTTIMDSEGKLNSAYFINGLNPDGDKFIEIEALLPNNLLLSSITEIPSISKIRVENTNAGDISNNTHRRLNINWLSAGSFVYEPTLLINYFIHGDTNFTQRKKIIPIDIIKNNSETIYVYPKPSNQQSLVVDKSVLNKTMLELSEGITDKSKYVIVNIELALKVYDENLSAYYSSTHQFLDQFSISLDSQIYSNIKSGHGIFASYISKNLPIDLDKEYIKSFGYRYAQ